MNGFTCLNCQRWVPANKQIGTAHRNHCPFCLWSKHVDLVASGDRKSRCQAGMEPIGLTFKRERPDKYKSEEKGELMIIHRCLACGKISINRIAADDKAEAILALVLKFTRDKLSGIDFLTKKDFTKIKEQLFGRK